jgi:membrane associated rhomboid family serine protease
MRLLYISILGDSDDFAIEIAAGSWFESLLFLGVTGFLVVGPLGAVGGTAVGIIMAYQFERKLWKKVSEAIQKKKVKIN